MFIKADRKMALADIKEGHFYLLDVSGDFYCDYVAFAIWDGCLLMVNVWEEGGGLRFTETVEDKIIYMARPLGTVDLSAKLESAYDTLLDLHQGSADGKVDVLRFYVFETDDLPEQVLERKQWRYPHETLRA